MSDSQFMRNLKRDELHLVKPKFQQMVLDAWQRNEEVPYGIITVSDQPASEADLKRVGELNAKYKWE